jgi:hypothetical protein
VTLLCAIPGCRIRDRHLPACSGDDCGGCLPRATDEGLVCTACEKRAEERLAAIIGLAPDARLVAYGLVRHSTSGGSGKPGSSSPANDDALDHLHWVNGRLTTIAREIADTRGLQEPAAGLGVAETLTEAAKFVSGQMRWLRHALDEQGGAYAAAVFAEIGDCASRMRGMVDGPAAQRFLGPCGAYVITGVHGDEIGDVSGHPCDGDVYGRPDAEHGSCRTCGTRYRRDERQAWLDGEVRTWAFTAKDIADAHGINVKTIRSWAERGQLTHHGYDREGRPLYLVGDVLDLAAESAARRETERAKRERRATDRETVEMGA